MSRLEQIWIKRMRGGPMDPADRATMKAGRGIVGNANQGGKRQVTIVSNKHWNDVTAPLGATPDPRLRRANLLVSDIDFSDARGKVLKVGSVRIRIYGETRPCEQMEEVTPGLQEAMKVPWGGGAFGEILDDGEIAVGDTVELQPSAV
ncbi:MAG TPA: MOSC domain-containing protein [Vicinamibacterales bacterium]|nr:MOSC domain-containing protein [Vicinamibacterales bacterium]